MSASLASQTERSAPPRPGCSIRTARTELNSASSALATAQVPSSLPLSAIVIRAVNGNRSRR